MGGVHPVQYRLDTFNMWHNLEAKGELRVRELEALQILVPPTWFCAHHAEVQPVLADPDVRVDAMPTANRATRRARSTVSNRDRQAPWTLPTRKPSSCSTPPVTSPIGSGARSRRPTCAAVALEIRRLSEQLGPFEEAAPVRTDVGSELPGRGHPLLPPMVRVTDGGRTIGSVTYTDAHAGAGEAVHGGQVMLLFDEMLGAWPDRSPRAGPRRSRSTTGA